MTGAEVIKMRDTLKANKNLPLRIYFSNSDICADESMVTQVFLWDDTNFIFYVFRLPDIQMDITPSNRQMAISVTAVDYGVIEAMEVGLLPVDYIDIVINSIRDSGKDVSTERADSIKQLFTLLLNPSIDKSKDDINKILSARAYANTEDWYKGTYKESNKY